MKFSRAFPPTDLQQLARMIVRPRWLAHFCGEFVSYSAWLVWHRRCPTVWNIPFSLVFAWPAPPPTPEQIARFNAERGQVNRRLKSSLEELQILVENAKRERAERTEKSKLNLGPGKHYWRCAGCGNFFSNYSELENLGESIGHTRILESGPVLCGPVEKIDLGDSGVEI